MGDGSREHVVRVLGDRCRELKHRVGFCPHHRDDADDGVLTNRRPFVQLPVGRGLPDGATVDTDGAELTLRPGTAAVLASDDLDAFVHANGLVAVVQSTQR